MKVKLLIGITVFAMLFSTGCNRNADNKLLKEKGQAQTAVLQLLQQIDSLGESGEFNPSVAKEFIIKAEEFGIEYPEDPMSIEFLYRAGLMAMTVAKASENPEETELYSQKALMIFDDIQKVYPEFNGVKNCILNKAIIFDDILHDYRNAEYYYREFIAKYPGDTLAINLESYLQYLGKTPEEIMLEFELN
jgi:hypothetical protein